jgi:hypothetical protein
VQFHISGCPISTRHAREGWYLGSSSGFSPKARGNGDLELWTLYAVELSLVIVGREPRGFDAVVSGLEKQRLGVLAELDMAVNIRETPET